MEIRLIVKTTPIVHLFFRKWKTSNTVNRSIDYLSPKEFRALRRMRQPKARSLFPSSSPMPDATM